MVNYSLDDNIPLQSDTTKNQLFDLTISAIDYYWLIEPPTTIELIFFWLNKLSPPFSLLTDLNHTKNKNYSNNYNINKEDNEMTATDLKCIKSKSPSDICKSYCNISDGISIQKFWSDNWKSYIDNFIIGRESDELA